MPRKRGRANGEGSIYEYPRGSGSWFAQIWLGEGKSIRRSAKTQREAREKLKKLQAEFEQGVNLTAKQPTVSEWCTTWLDTFAPNLKPNVREDYEGVIKRYIDGDTIGKRRLDKLTPTEVQAWVNRLATRVAPQTVRNAHARLHKALEVAVKNNYVPRNVASSTELPSLPKTDIQPLNFEQVQKLLDTVEGHRWSALYRLAVNLGMREAELFGLTWPAIDFERGTLRIFQQLRRARPEKGAAREFILQTTKTKAGERTLRLDEDLLEVLREHKLNQDEERALLGDKWRDPWGKLVFTTETGGPIHISCLLDHFRQVLKKAELSEIRFHDLRHTAATLMLADGVPLVTVSKILGHSSPAVTAQIYAHALDESKSVAIAGLSQKLRRPRRRATQSTTQSTPETDSCSPDEEREIPHPNAGAGDGTRTRTGLPPAVFKTAASAVSPLRRRVGIIARRRPRRQLLPAVYQREHQLAIAGHLPAHRRNRRALSDATPHAGQLHLKPQRVARHHLTPEAHPIDSGEQAELARVLR
jgi:integrase